MDKRVQVRNGIKLGNRLFIRHNRELRDVIIYPYYNLSYTMSVWEAPGKGLMSIFQGLILLTNVNPRIDK